MNAIQTSGAARCEPYVYVYRVRPFHSILKAGESAAEFISEMVGFANLVKIATEETHTMTDGALVIAAMRRLRAEDLTGRVVAAAAVIELAARLRASTAHPVIAADNREAIYAWVHSPAVKAESLAALEARIAMLEAADPVPTIH